jgi:hypothetical protein
VQWSVAASNQFWSPCYHLNQEINLWSCVLYLGLLSDFPYWTWRIGTFIEIWLYLYCMSWCCFFSNLKAFSLSIVSSFLQLPILCNKANVERPSIDFKLSNRKGCLVLSVESKHRLPNFQLVFRQLFCLDTKKFSIKISPQVLRNVWIRFTIMDLQYDHLVEDNDICIFS